jgi:hypothetical protein
MKLNDRNLAVILGRALAAQKFIHEVTYAKKFRDSPKEIYKCQISKTLIADLTTSREMDTLPTGVFTILTDCYAPTCAKEKFCYSVSCPRKLEQVRGMRSRNRIR